MPSAKFTETYDKVSKMGEKLKAASKPGPSNDEQLQVRFPFHSIPFMNAWMFPIRLQYNLGRTTS